MSSTVKGSAFSIPEDGYRLGRDYASSNRLCASHFLVERILGFNLHPIIPLPIDKKDLKIADVGTGTGIWLVELSSELPDSVQLDGFDVSSDQFPYQGYLPSNVSLHKLDIIHGQIPEHLQEHYDIIQVRFFALVVQKNDPTPILRNVNTMLKPGGYLQWVDIDHRNTFVDTAKPGLKKTGAEAYVKQLNALQDFDWTAKLPEHFASTGFSLVDHKFDHPKPHLRNYALDLFLAGAAELSYYGMGKCEGVAMREAVREAWEESRLGAIAVNSPEVWVGRKLEK